MSELFVCKRCGKERREHGYDHEFWPTQWHQRAKAASSWSMMYCRPEPQVDSARLRVERDHYRKQWFDLMNQRDHEIAACLRAQEQAVRNERERCAVIAEGFEGVYGVLSHARAIAREIREGLGRGT